MSMSSSSFLLLVFGKAFSFWWVANCLCFAVILAMIALVILSPDRIMVPDAELVHSYTKLGTLLFRLIVKQTKLRFLMQHAQSFRGNRLSPVIFEVKSFCIDQHHLQKYTELCRRTSTEQTVPLFYFSAVTYPLIIETLLHSSFPYSLVSSTLQGTKIWQYCDMPIGSEFKIRSSLKGRQSHPLGSLCEVEIQVAIVDRLEGILSLCSCTLGYL